MPDPAHPKPERPFVRRLADFAAAVMIAAALAAALEAVRGLGWPYDPDHFRDIGQAQAALDGDPLADPLYRDESVWYNPLIPWVVAAVAGLTDASPETAHVAAGPWLNLLAPVAFYALGVQLLGRAAALPALAIYLFLACGQERSWACATYSPWLFTANAAQGLFYASVLALSWAARKPRGWRRPALAGAAIGATFLAHTAPAIVLGAIAVALLPARGVALAAAAAALTASPFLWSVAGQYGLAMVNLAPSSWRYTPLTAAGLPQLAARFWPLAGAGALGLAASRPHALVAWLAAALALTGLTIARDLVDALPPVVPAIHFWLYTTAALSLAAGAAVAWLLRGRLAFALPVTLAVVGVMYPAYRGRADLVEGRASALARDPAEAAVSRFLRTFPGPGEVVAAPDDLALHVVGPAGLRTVAVGAEFSNPYVDREPRAADRDRLLAAIRSGDVETVAVLAGRYRARAALLRGDQACGAASARFPVVFSRGAVCLVRLELPK